MNFWQSIERIGIQHGANPTERRYIRISNRVSAIVFILVLLLFIVALLYFQWIASTQLALVSALTFLIPLLLNHLGYHNLSKLVLIVIITVPSLVVSIIDKFDHPQSLEEFEYFQFRIILLGSTILPFILFSLKEKAYLTFGILLSVFCVVGYDPIHNFFGAGYFQMGFTSPNYYFLNYIIVFCQLILMGSTYFLKYSFEKSEAENESLIDQLSERQAEILAASGIIQQQREKLVLENRNLNNELVEKNNQLTQTNEELIRHNNELQQFSYTISHNLRGPVASLTGLLHLLDQESLNKTNIEIYGHLAESVNALDTTIKDLSNIIDIRNDITRIRQKLSLQDEINKIVTLLKKEITINEINIIIDFDQHPYIYSVRPMLHSILYNLVSNAIKYRSLERNPFIKISSSTNNGAVQLIVEDNGLGIDLENFGAKLFGLYKRFHTHAEGRGLGLFLVKLQVESLEGNIAVESTPNSGTMFTLTFDDPGNMEEQILLDNEVAMLYFNAPLDCIGINWKKVATFEQSKDLIKRSIDFIKNYQTRNWISNLTHVVNREEEDLNDFRKQSRDELRKAGLKRIGVILPQELLQEGFTDRKRFENVYDAEVQLFSSTTAAKQWIEEENAKDNKVHEDSNLKEVRGDTNLG